MNSSIALVPLTTIHPNLILAPSTPTPTPIKLIISPLLIKTIAPIQTNTPTTTPTPTLTPTISPTAKPVNANESTTLEIELSQTPSATPSISLSPTTIPAARSTNSFASQQTLTGIIIVLVLALLYQQWPTIKQWLHKKTE